MHLGEPIPFAWQDYFRQRCPDRPNADRAAVGPDQQRVAGVGQDDQAHAVIVPDRRAARYQPDG